ncbi:MAG: hypothetical protein H7328_07650 [Bdellovibrio sp.]|nr:hypothetical protein [Bdellovibrio sp.]
MKNISKKLLTLAITLTSVSSLAAPQSVLQRVREGYFMIAGFPSSIISNGPPQDGLISFAEFFSSSAQSIAGSNGVSSCAEVPATGTVSTSLTIPTALQAFLGSTALVTMTYETPVVTAPSGWSGAGSLFQKRVKVTKAGGIAFVMEFNCNTNELFASISIPGDTIDTSMRDINMYIQKNGAALAVDFLMTVTISSRATLIDSQMVRLTTTDGDLFKVWNINVTMRDATYNCQGSSCGNQYGYERSFIQGSSATKTGSVYVKMDKPDLTLQTNATLRAATITSSVTSAAAVGSFDFSANEPNQGIMIEKSGCVNFVTLADPASGAYCNGAGSTLAAPATAPLANAGGAFTVNWVKTSLKAAMKFAN